MDEPVTTALQVEPAPEAVPAKETPERPSRWRWLLRGAALSVVVGLFGLLVWATLSAGSGNSLVARIAAGEAPAAPTFSLEVLWPRAETWPMPARRRLGDGRLDLGELRGRPVVVNFWASWCIPCRDEAPILNASARAHAGEVFFLGVNVQDLKSDALAFSRTPYVSVRDRGNGTYEDYGLTGVPETYYVDSGDEGPLSCLEHAGLVAERSTVGLSVLGTWLTCDRRTHSTDPVEQRRATVEHSLSNVRPVRRYNHGHGTVRTADQRRRRDRRAREDCGRCIAPFRRSGDPLRAIDAVHPDQEGRGG